MKWRKIAGWILAVLALLVVCVGVGGYLFLKSSAFNQFAMREIAEAAQQATGAPTTIGRLDFSFSTLTAHLYNITVHGTEGAGEAPLLHIDKLTVGLKIQSALHRKVNLSEIVIEHPVARVRVDGSGKSNLPTAPPGKGSSKTSVFDLAVRHAQLTRGEVTYNDRETPLDADLYDLGAEIHFDELATRYSGSLSYDNGHLRYGQYEPLPHSFEAKFSATPTLLSIESAVLKVGNSVASVRGNLSNYAEPVVAGDYNIRMDAIDFASMAPAHKPAGDLLLTGQIHYRSIPHQSALRGLTVDGEIASESLSAVAAGGRVSARKLRGSYQLADGALRARNIEFDFLGGHLNADLSVQYLDATPSLRARASLHNVSLRDVQQALVEVKQIAVSGTLNGTADASWAGSVSKIRLSSDLAVSAAAKSTSSISTTSTTSGNIPINGTIHASYDGARNSLTLRQSTLRIPSVTLTADGEISDRSDLRLQASTNDLHQLESLVSAFRGSGFALPPISGSASVNATVRGSLAKPQITGQFSAQDLNVQDSEWRSVQAGLAASPSQIEVTNGTLVSAHRGRAAISGTVALLDWNYLPSNSMRVNLSLQQMSIAELQRIANLQYPVSGDLTATVSLTGTQLDPEGSGRLQIANAQVYSERIQTFAAQFHSDHGAVISTLHVVLPAGTADADLSYTPRTKAYTVRIDAPSLTLQKLHAVQAKNFGLSGTLTASASGRGTLDDPQLSATLRLPQLEVRDKSISNIEAELHVANQKADLTLSSKVVDASVQAHASVNLTGDYYTDASIETTAIPLDALLATYLSNVPEGLKGQTELHATLKGPLNDKTQLEAHLTIPTLSATYQSLQIGIASPVKADYSHSVLTIQPAEIRGTDTSFKLQGNIPLAGNTPASLIAQGSIDARIIKIFSPDTKSSGAVSFDIRASGTAQDPSVSGQIRLQDVAMLYAGAPLGVEKLNGTLDIGKESIQISKLTGQVGGGDVSAGGSIVYRPNLRFNLALQSKSVRLRYPDGLRTLLDSNLTFSGNKTASTLSGRVLIDSLSFTPDFDLSSFSDQFSGDTAIPAQPGFADTIKLAIGVQSKENLSANSTQISLEGSVNVQVGGTAANPVITGRTDLTAGELFYRNVRYQLQRGIISFDNPNTTSPVLNVSATTTVEQYNLTLNLRGPFDKLTTSYTSDPPLSTADIINLIARGQTTQESAASSQSTDSMIASQATSQLTGSLQKIAGISSLQINPGLGGSNQNSGATIAVQQRVTKNFLFTFSTDVSQPGSEVVQGEYQINKRWSVSATRDQVGGVSVDGRLHTRF
jgi:translocation and assembly module TamB